MVTCESNLVKEKNFASFQKQKNQKLKKVIAETRKNNKILKNQLLQNQRDNSNNNIHQNEMTKLKVSMDILKKENEELKLKVEKLEKERDAVTKKNLHCQSENISNRELIQELRTSQSKLTSDLEICKSADVDRLISDKELEECNQELEAEKKKNYQCESEKKICQEEIISFATAPVTTTTTSSMPWTTNSALSYTVLVLSTRYSHNKPMTVDFNGKNNSDFLIKTIFIFDI